MTLVPVTHNLVLLHTPHRQDISDFMTIANMMLGQGAGHRSERHFRGGAVRAERVAELAPRPTLILFAMPNQPAGRRAGQADGAAAGQHQYADNEQALAEAGFPHQHAVLVERHEQLAAIDIEPSP